MLDAFATTGLVADALAAGFRNAERSREAFGARHDAVIDAHFPSGHDS